MVRPNSIKFAGRRCGGGIDSVHDGRAVSASAAVCTVKSDGVIVSSSDHRTGNETGVPGRRRGL
jgi:hypothetical protein